MLELSQIKQGHVWFELERDLRDGHLAAAWERCVRVATRRFGRAHGIDPNALVVIKFPATIRFDGGVRIDIAVGPPLYGLGGPMQGRGE